MDTEVLDLVEGNRLVVAGLSIGRGVILHLSVSLALYRSAKPAYLWIGSKRADLHFSSRDCTVRIDYYGKERIKDLIVELGSDIDAGEPAAIAWVRMIPPDYIFRSSDLWEGTACQLGTRKRLRE